MGLKQDIVIVNEFSVPLPGGKGSRGATPGAYVERYMARDGATESLAPVRLFNSDDFIVRYMARESAVEHARTKSQVKSQMREAQGLGGVAFGYGQVSLSDEQLQAASADIQSWFDSGHTVMKTVVSFDEEYLRRHGIVDADFKCSKAGDYRGHIDQMKLRMAAMQGLDRMAGAGFDDLRYVGTYQVDTEHVHLHLAMVDAGRGRRAKDGMQKGKLLDKHKSRLRRGMDSWLDEKQTVRHLSSAVGYERRNVTTFIKRWAHQQISEEALPQFIMACLPEDRSLWRAGTNDARMRKANALVTELVDEQLERPGSPLPMAMEKIYAYANNRRENESLNTEDWQKLVDAGRDQIVERAVNGVYQMLKSLPEDELRIRTPMLDAMGMDYEQMARLTLEQHDDSTQEPDELVSFGFRLRTYASRLRHHKEQARSYRDLKNQWERADEANVAPEQSRPLYDFYRFEEEYQRQLMAKYQHFLPFMGDESAWVQRHQEVSEYGQKMLALRSLRNDASLQRMKNGNEAEDLGRRIYGQPGGRLLTQGKSGREVIDARLRTMKAVYDQKLDVFRGDLAAVGLVLRPTRLVSGTVSPAEEVKIMDEAEPGEATDIRKGAAFEFDDVKALDLHHMDYDFFTDVKVGATSRDAFQSVCDTRRRLLLKAIEYLDSTNQSEAINDLPVDDVASMAKTSAALTERREPNGESWLTSKFAKLRASKEAAKTNKLSRTQPTSLDAQLAVQVRAQVDTAVIEHEIELPDSFADMERG